MNEEHLPSLDFDKVLNLRNIHIDQFNYNKALDNIIKSNDNYKKELLTVSDKKHSLQTNIRELTDSTSNILRDIQINDISFNIINNEINDVYDKIEESRTNLAQLRNEKAQLRNMLKSKTKEYESSIKNKMFRDPWSLKLSYLQLLLGISISNENSSMKITFSRLSNSNPYRSCYIILKLTDNKYTGISCEPKLKNFNKFVSDLNNGLDFGSFLCLIRQSFKTTL